MSTRVEANEKPMQMHAGRNFRLSRLKRLWSHAATQGFKYGRRLYVQIRGLLIPRWKFNRLNFHKLVLPVNTLNRGNVTNWGLRSDSKGVCSVLFKTRRHQRWKHDHKADINNCVLCMAGLIWQLDTFKKTGLWEQKVWATFAPLWLITSSFLLL